MNICFLSSKIISQPYFKFVLNKNHKIRKKTHICILLTDLEIDEKTIVKLKFYDEVAEFCYKEIHINDNIVINGIINDTYEIEVNECYKLKLRQ